MEQIIRYALEHEKQQIIDLFNVCFPGESDWAKRFFDNIYAAENTLVCVENDMILACIQMLPVVLKLDEKQYNAAYLYGVGTLPAFRGKKIMERIIEHAFEENKKNNVDFSILITQNDGLFDYYKKFGYEKYFYTYKKEFDVVDPHASPFVIPLEKRHIADILNIYECANAARLHSARSTQHMELISQIFYPEAYVFDAGAGATAYAIAYVEDGTLHVVEAAGEHKEELLRGICAIKNIRKCSVDSPEVMGNLSALGMIKKITTSSENLSQWGYINLLYN